MTVSHRTHRLALVAMYVFLSLVTGCGEAESPQAPTGDAPKTVSEAAGTQDVEPAVDMPPSAVVAPEAQEPEPVAPAPWPADQSTHAKNIEVVWAVWGKDGRWSDVSSVVTSHIEKGELWATQKAMNTSGAVPSGNELRLLLNVAGESMYFTMPGRGGIRFTIDPKMWILWRTKPTEEERPGIEAAVAQALGRSQTAEHPRTVRVLMARLGIEARNHAVTDQVNEQLAMGQALISDYKRFGFSKDPTPRRRTLLNLFIDSNGELLRVLLPPGATFAVNPPAHMTKIPRLADELHPAIVAKRKMGTPLLELMLGADGQYLCALDIAGAQYMKFDPESLETVAVLPGLPASLAYTDRFRDGRVVLAGAPNGHSAYRFEEEEYKGVVCIIDPHAMKMVGLPFEVPVDICGIGVDRWGKLYAGSGSGQSTFIAQLDLISKAVSSKNKGVNDGSLYHMHPDRTRLFMGTTGVSPGSFEAVNLDRTKDFAEQERYGRWTGGDTARGGDFSFLDEGKYLLARSGVISTITQVTDQAFVHLGDVEPNVSGFVIADRLYLSLPSGRLRIYSFPELTLIREVDLGFAIHSPVIDKQHRLAWAVLTPNAKLRNGVVETSPQGILAKIDLSKLEADW